MVGFNGILRNHFCEDATLT